MADPSGAGAPAVSVVIPAYNQARYLPAAIASVQAQTFRDWEAIVVDDGSSDDTADAVRGFAEDRLRYLYQDNRGLAGARNSGIRAARGEYIALLDADDEWAMEFLSALVTRLAREPGLGAVGCGWQAVDEEGRALFERSHAALGPAQLKRVLPGADPLVPSGMVVRRAVCEAVGGFDDSLPACEDWDMWLRIAERYPIDLLPGELVRLRFHGANMSRDLERMYRSWRRVLDKHWGETAEPASVWPAERREAYASCSMYQVAGYLGRRDLESAARFLREAWDFAPERSASLDMYYMLACAHQPPGQRGNTEVVNFERAASDVMGLLRPALAGMPPGAIGAGRALGRASLALALLAYNCGRTGDACRWLAQAMRYDPGAAGARRFWSLALRALAPARIVQARRALKAPAR